MKVYRAMFCGACKGTKAHVGSRLRIRPPCPCPCHQRQYRGYGGNSIFIDGKRYEVIVLAWIISSRMRKLTLEDIELQFIESFETQIWYRVEANNLKPQLFKNDLEFKAFRFMLKFGRAWKAAKLPRSVKRGLETESYANATRLARKEEGRLTYVEGYASDIGEVFGPHAWCVDSQGRVLDPTWSDDTYESLYYYGVSFNTEWLEAQTYGETNQKRFQRGEGRAYGVIINEVLGHPALSGDPDKMLDPRWRAPYRKYLDSIVLSGDP